MPKEPITFASFIAAGQAYLDAHPDYADRSVMVRVNGTLSNVLPEFRASGGDTVEVTYLPVPKEQ